MTGAARTSQRPAPGEASSPSEGHSARRPVEAAAFLSVVVPVLDEEARLPAQLDALAEHSGILEVLVVDGGSRDGTVSLAQGRPGVRVLRARRGRGPQLNAGAAAARGDVLLFLHADVRLPVDASRWIREALEDPKVVGGAFRVRTVPDGPRPWFAPLLGLADLRSRRTRLPYGDQSLFVRRAAFRAVGGYPDQPLFEDLEFARRLRRQGTLVLLPVCVEVSARRYQRRPLRTALAHNVFPLLYRLGVPAERLARWYPTVR
ncbi:MAG: glycosyltransferase [Planctomycetota bacterium]|nr:MAG: glycosyltransferase [Planctomycetota bacterium]